MVRAISVRCTCLSHGCHKLHNGPLGYTKLSRPTQQKHREDDLELSLRRLSLDDNGLDDNGTHNIANNRQAGTAIAKKDKPDSLILQFISILEEYQIRLQFIDRLTEILEGQPESMPMQSSKDSVTMQGRISWMTATVCNLETLSVGNSDSLDQQRSMLVQLLQKKLTHIRRWEESCYDVVSENRKNELTCAQKNGNGESVKNSCCFFLMFIL